MKKKIFSILLIPILALTITGCGNSNSNSTKEYTDAMMELRNFNPAILEEHTVGELLDVALSEATWEEKEDYSFSSGAIIVTGTDKNSGDKVELIWLTNPESGTPGFKQMTKGNEAIGYTQFLSYLIEYID